MATATNTGLFMPSDNINHAVISPKLKEIIQKVRSLRSLTKNTGFYTTKSIGALLSNLSPDELVVVAESLELTTPEMPRK